MDTTIEELEKCECVSSVMNIAPILNIEREQVGTLEILLKNNGGVYVCICSVYSNILKEFTEHAFFYDSYFSTKVKSACRGAIIDNRRYSPICVLEGKDRESKHTLNDMLRNIFQGTCTVNYAFKVTSRDIWWHITDIYLLLYCDLTYRIGKLKTKTNLNSNWPDNWFYMKLFQNNSTNLKRNVFHRSDGSGTGMRLSLI